ncbi:spermatogenesis-associated protein 6-like isoform X3 [Ruditapes philippinarum]|uniref:spermatogenesis-associated protein 6-like isoform X3 n=1 Tax=Ruditapes philippinarum TaxID=129788 RepID=UPI00295B7290|nr:spermatogenesis-associated protein 6-like isoform X3 [Ruditapes philippinarum]
MPRRALRCVVDLDLARVSAPGVWLPSREDLYISISVFGQYRNTRNVTSIFPMILHEPFRFEKTYYTAVDPQDVAEFLEDELVVIELLQYSDYSDGAVRLASYSTSAREFLFPYPSLCPSYTSACREILLSRTIAWPGISPKLEFTTKTVIKESQSPELDALEDALEEEKLARRARSRSRSMSRTRGRSMSRSRSRTRTCRSLTEDIPDSLCITISRSRSYSSDSDSALESYDSDPSYMRPTISSIFRSRSKSGVRKSYADESLSDTEGGNKAPFVVRHLEDSLIGRKPGAPALKGQKKKKKSKRSSSRPSSALSGYDSWDDYSVIRDASGSLPVYTTKYVSDDEDLEVAELTSKPSYLTTPRPRSASPFLYRPSFSSRFSRPVSPALSAAERLEVELAVERARARARARALIRARSPSPIRSYTPILRGSIDDLALDTSIARSRSWVHLDAGQYWTQRAAELTGTSHKQVFKDNMNKLYNGLLRNAVNHQRKVEKNKW